MTDRTRLGVEPTSGVAALCAGGLVRWRKDAQDRPKLIKRKIHFFGQEGPQLGAMRGAQLRIASGAVVEWGNVAHMDAAAGRAF